MRGDLYIIANGFPLKEQLYLQGIALLGTVEQVQEALYEAEQKIGDIYEGL